MRRSFYLTTICGTALALSAPALAQDAKPSETQAQTRTVQTRSATKTDAQSILRRLEGLWSIEVRVNEALWNMKGVERDNWSNRNDPKRSTTNREDLTNHTIDHNRQAENDRTQPDSDRPTIDRTNRPAHAYDGSQPVQSRTMRGAADTSLIMGGKILRERAFINNTMDASSSASGEQDRRTGAARINPSSSMNTLSFISFDEGSGTYSAVFMSSKDGMMHFDSGEYDASRNRIVFEGRRDRNDSVYRGRTNASPDGRIGDDFIEDSYPGKSDAPSTTDRDLNDPNAVNPRPSDRTNRDTDGRTTADRDRTTTDRNTPDPIERDRTTTDRTTTDRNPVDRTSQPEQDRPVRENDLDQKPYWENNTPDGRKPGATQPDADRPSNNRSGLNPGGDYVVVPAHGQNVRVVLELLSNDQYRVTMYEGGSIEWSDSTNNRVNTNPASHDATNRDGTGRTTTDGHNANRTSADQPDANRVNTTMLAGNVVYQATFTRATGADATAYRQMFDADNR